MADTPGIKPDVLTDMRVRVSPGLPFVSSQKMLMNNDNVVEGQDLDQERYDEVLKQMKCLSRSELEDVASTSIHWLFEVLRNPSEFNVANAESFLKQHMTHYR